MANQEHLAKLKEGVEAWNKWRKKNPDIKPDLSKANLRETDLREAYLLEANLTEANLSGADLRGADLRVANLRGANLSEANLNDVHLSKANLSGANLSGANLSGASLNVASLNDADLRGAKLIKTKLIKAKLLEAKLSGADLSGADLSEANLSEANLGEANLSEANLSEANLSKTNLSKANLSGANLSKTNPICANLRGADLSEADLRRADLISADLRGADLRFADLSGADLSTADLSGADLLEAKLHGTKMRYAKLQGAYFRRVEVDGSTMIWGCRIDRYRGEGIEYTDFEGVGLGDIRIDKPGRQLLEYNIRRANWNRWYIGEKPWQDDRPGFLLRSCVRMFWKLSDYGASTRRIIFWFFILSFVFAAVYYTWGAVDQYVLHSKVDPGIVENLFVINEHGVNNPVNKYLVPFRAFYFSIVTMTTLGFGDLYASTASLWRGIFGHLLLGVQVILGYVMLGAMVTRFAAMFTGGGPAGKFAPTQKPPKPTEKQPQIYPLWQIMGYFWL